MDISGLINFFSNLAFPIAAAGYLLVITSRQLERLRTNQLKMLVLLCLISEEFDISIPDSELAEVVEQLKAKHERRNT